MRFIDGQLKRRLQLVRVKGPMALRVQPDGARTPGIPSDLVEAPNRSG